jgi:Tfp pilus assembly major pilin PilA
MFGIGLPELIVLVVIIGIPVGIIALIMALANSRQRRQLRHNNRMFLTYCAKCGKEVTEGSSFCKHCGEKLPDVHDVAQVPAASSVITNEDYASFVGIKTEKYLPKFKKFSAHEMDNFRATWHWPAFFVPFWWMLYRKLYGWAILAFFVGIIPYINLLVRVVWAITANYIYYKHAKKKLSEIKQIYPSPEAQKAVIAVSGGVGSLALIIGLVMALVAVIGIIAAISIPMYKAFTVKAKVSYVVHAMDAVRVAEVMVKVEEGRYKDCADAGEIQSKLGVAVDSRYMTEIKVTAGTITAKIGSTNSDADGKTLTLMPDATSETWTWGGTVPTRYKPRN